MKQQYIQPEIIVQLIQAADIITLSQADQYDDISNKISWEDFIFE